MKNYKILISDSTVLFHGRLHSGSNKNKNSRTHRKLRKSEKVGDKSLQGAQIITRQGNQCVNISQVIWENMTQKLDRNEKLNHCMRKSYFGIQFLSNIAIFVENGRFLSTKRTDLRFFGIKCPNFGSEVSQNEVENSLKRASLFGVHLFSFFFLFIWRKE